jgi:hypothetical protein
MVHDKWMMRRRGVNDTHSKRAEAMEDDMMGAGSTLAKHGVSENDEDAQTPLIQALKSWPSKVVSAIHDPPPPSLKGRKAGGGPEWSLSPLIQAC